MEGSCYQVESTVFLCLPGQPFQDECGLRKNWEQVIYRKWTELSTASVAACPLLDFANSLLISVVVSHLCSFASMTVHSVLGCSKAEPPGRVCYISSGKEGSPFMLTPPQCLPVSWPPVTRLPGPSLALPLSGPRAADCSQILGDLADVATNPRACQSPHRSFSNPLASRKVKCHLEAAEHIPSQLFHSLENDFLGTSLRPSG